MKTIPLKEGDADQRKEFIKEYRANGGTALGSKQYQKAFNGLEVVQIGNCKYHYVRDFAKFAENVSAVKTEKPKAKRISTKDQLRALNGAIGGLKRENNRLRQSITDLEARLDAHINKEKGVPTIPRWGRG